jgi:hypothetical protein
VVIYQKTTTGYFQVISCFSSKGLFMKNLIILFVSLFTFLVIAPAQAGTKVVLEVEVTQGDKVEKSTEIITYDEKRFRIDILGTEKKVTPQTPYIMTVDNG